MYWVPHSIPANIPCILNGCSFSSKIASVQIILITNHKRLAQCTIIWINECSRRDVPIPSQYICLCVKYPKTPGVQIPEVDNQQENGIICFCREISPQFPPGSICERSYLRSIRDGMRWRAVCPRVQQLSSRRFPKGPRLRDRQSPRTVHV